jgi:hypothetical protein
MQADGTTAARYASIHRVAEATTARPYELRYQDGTVVRASRRYITRGVLPVGFHPAQVASIPPAATVLALQAALPDGLPDTFDLTTAPTARRALAAVMPGDWNMGYAQALVALHDGMDPTSHPSGPHQLPCLLASVDFSGVPLAVDPWAHPAPGLQQAQRALLPHLTLLPLSPAPVADHLHAGPYRAASAAGHLPVVLSAPSPHALDMVAGLSATFASHASFLLAPATYLSHAPGGRRQFLTRLSQEGRLRIVLGSPVLPGATQLMWVCMFATKALQHRMTRTPAL